MAVFMKKHIPNNLQLKTKLDYLKYNNYGLPIYFWKKYNIYPEKKIMNKIILSLNLSVNIKNLLLSYFGLENKIIVSHNIIIAHYLLMVMLFTTQHHCRTW